MPAPRRFGLLDRDGGLFAAFNSSATWAGRRVPVPAASRAIAFSGNFNTVPVNSNVNAAAFLLDPRGYTISGADVSFAVVPSAGDTGAAQFVSPAAMQTTWDGSAIVTVKLTAQGKVQLSPSLTSPILAQWVLLQE